jgi:hypothetical protein
VSLVKYNNNSISAVTSAAAIPSGAMTHIKTLTASSSSTLSFVDGSSDVVLDSTYPIYVFKFINIHPASDGVAFYVNFRDGGSAYDAVKTTTYFLSRHAEDDSSSELSYKTGQDLAQSTSPQYLTVDSDNNNDSSQSGEMFLFNPASTTFVKHFMSRVQGVQTNQHSMENFVAGYCNTTTAIDGVQFTMSSGNIDSGVIKLYGVS